MCKKTTLICRLYFTVIYIYLREDLEEQINQKNKELERFRLDVHEYEDEIVLLRRKSGYKLGIKSGRESLTDIGELTDSEKITHLEEEV